MPGPDFGGHGANHRRQQFADQSGRHMVQVVVGVASFFLIRHAESPWTLDDSRSLSSGGAKASAKLADRLAEFEVNAIYSSPYRRALQTIEPLATRLGVRIQTVDALRERYLGSFSPLSFSDAARQSWQDFDVSWPGGENSRTAQRRIVDFVEGLAAGQPRGPTALSTHGNVLALLLNAYDESVGYEFWNSLRFPDAFRLEIHSHGRAEFARLP